MVETGNVSGVVWISFSIATASSIGMSELVVDCWENSVDVDGLKSVSDEIGNCVVDIGLNSVVDEIGICVVDDGLNSVVDWGGNCVVDGAGKSVVDGEDRLKGSESTSTFGCKGITEIVVLTSSMMVVG